jgi:hypothetical protein
VLEANNPRFPWEALHTTLKNGLNYGTKKSRRSPQQTLTSCGRHRRQATAGKPAAPYFRPPRRGDAPGPLKMTSGSAGECPAEGVPVPRNWDAGQLH